jgi:alpha/beta superfamily hydrolase
MTESHVGSAVLRTVDDLYSPAGRLEALLNAGAPDAPFSALVAHPHPLGGGTMHNKVVYHTMKAFQSLGVPVLRFNFRGTGLSEGIHDYGHGEQDDVRAALDWLTKEFNRPVLFAGFSFGSYVGLRVCCCDPRVRGLVALGLPIQAEGRSYTYEFLADCSQPKLFISGDRDQYGPVAGVEAAVARAGNPRQLIWISGVDHFFNVQAAPVPNAETSHPAPRHSGSKLEEVREAIRLWAQEWYPQLRRK